jgi:hypothetical protein
MLKKHHVTWEEQTDPDIQWGNVVPETYTLTH